MTTMSMDLLLGELNEAEGVRGCALSTADGMIIKSDLRGRFREDVISGLASFLISTTRRALEDAERDGNVSRFVVHATHGKLVVAAAGQAFLVVITDQFARLDALLELVDDVALRLERITMMLDDLDSGS